MANVRVRLGGGMITVTSDDPGDRQARDKALHQHAAACISEGLCQWGHQLGRAEGQAFGGGCDISGPGIFGACHECKVAARYHVDGEHYCWTRLHAPASDLLHPG